MDHKTTLRHAFTMLGFIVMAGNLRAATVSDLRCEDRIDPMGIDVPRPRLSWIINSERRGDRQTAVRILAASDPALLAEGAADLWDSGKLDSNQSVQVEYAGKLLRPVTVVWWKTRVWDSDGKASEWSQPALWSMGLNPRDWTARWIGYDAAYQPPAETARDRSLFSTKSLAWAQLPAGKSVDSHELFLRKAFALSDDRKVRRAVMALYADNTARVTVNGRAAGEANRWEATAWMDVSSLLQNGQNVLAISARNSDLLPAAVIGKLVVQFEKGDDLQVPIDATWKAAAKPAEGWDRSGFQNVDWTAAATVTKTPWGTPALNDSPRMPASYLRKQFAVRSQVKRATVYVTALGAYELHFNGKRVGRDVLTPGWSSFDKRVYYQTYDVTELIHVGDNAVAAILGDGWYAGQLAFTGRRNFYGGKPRLLAQLVIELADGSRQIVATDDTFKASYGPILHGDLLLGCEYDARIAMAGWDQPRFDDSHWASVRQDGGGLNGKELAPPEILAAVAEPARVCEELPAVKVTEPTSGIYLFDLGQNMVGWARLKVSGARGQLITLRHGEMLNPDGTLYTANLRGATAADFYHLAGGGEETLEPYFTFHGFRYVEVRGLTAKPDPSMITGLVVHTDMARTGQFECSSPLINQLYHNIIWGQKGNYLEVPTDCPQRDERAGWTGDTQFFIPTAAYNFDVAPFFTRWLTTICEDSQYPDGSFAHVSPDLGLGSGATAWGDAALICSYNVYRTYGDTRVIAAHFPAMDRYMRFVASKADKLVPNIGGFGDWLNLGGSASRPVIDAAYYAYLSELMSEMAAAVGRLDDAARYRKLHDDIKAVFAGFFRPDGSLIDSSQTGYALAFSMDLVPDRLKEQAAAKFADEVKRFDWHLATGFIGTPRLLPGLHEARRDDVAYRLLLRETYPSWLFQVKLGATTMWERWDGWTPDRGFQSMEMNSFNHYAFGAVGEYLYGMVGGIRPAAPGYRQILIEPTPGEGITWANTSFRSVHGTISTRWKRSDGSITLDVSIPANTTAIVRIPSSGAAPVEESGQPAATAAGVKLVEDKAGGAVFAVESGTYHFRAGP